MDVRKFTPVFYRTSALWGHCPKREVAEAILAQPKGQHTLGAVKMPPLTDSTQLKDRIGPNSRYFFDALDIDTNFLSEPVKDWQEIPAFQKFQSFVKNTVRNTIKFTVC